MTGEIILAGWWVTMLGVAWWMHRGGHGDGGEHSTEKHA